MILVLSALRNFYFNGHCSGQIKNYGVELLIGYDMLFCIKCRAKLPDSADFCLRFNVLAAYFL